MEYLYLDNQAEQYRKTNDPKLLTEIMNTLENVITNKAKYVYYHQTITCQGKTFNLFRTNLTTFEDVKQELYLTILEKINTYDVTKPFLTYLYSSIWHWKPSFVNRDFVNQLRTYKESELATEDNPQPLINIAKFYEIDYDILWGKIEVLKLLDEQEQEIIDQIFINPNAKQKDIAKILKLSESRISQIIKNIKRKIRKV